MSLSPSTSSVIGNGAVAMVIVVMATAGGVGSSVHGQLEWRGEGLRGHWLGVIG